MQIRLQDCASVNRMYDDAMTGGREGALDAACSVETGMHMQTVGFGAMVAWAAQNRSVRAMASRCSGWKKTWAERSLRREAQRFRPAYSGQVAR